MPRQKKDPNKPKGKMSAYAFFVQSEREAIRSRYKDSGKEGMPSLSELSKFCSEKWKCLDDSKKTPFLKLAADDKARYDEEMATYVPSEDDETPKKSRKRKRQVDENHPKRNRSAFMFFCDDERPKVRESQPELAMTEISKVLGKKWAEIESSMKEKYTKQAEDDRERYAKEMENYKKTALLENPSTKKQK